MNAADRIARMARYDTWSRRLLFVNVFLAGMVVGVIAVASLLR